MSLRDFIYGWFAFDVIKKFFGKKAVPDNLVDQYEDRLDREDDELNDYVSASPYHYDIDDDNDYALLFDDDLDDVLLDDDHFDDYNCDSYDDLDDY